MTPSDWDVLREALRTIPQTTPSGWNVVDDRQALAALSRLQAENERLEAAVKDEAGQTCIEIDLRERAEGDFRVAKEVIAGYEAEVERLRGALERIAWHELTWKEARDAARAALQPERDAG